ncbi:uncharacterized protein STAUR_2021 [Stigmatella aurantiaca DW4/3-1]|nr:uncharacterized protein STAUR_2021 [Stigmatella aurantiaca DW4/3-1]
MTVRLSPQCPPWAPRRERAHMLKKMAWLLPTAALHMACGDEETPNLDNNALMLADPEVFDIGMDPNLFASDVLSQYPDIKDCHTQGLELVGDQIFLSCTLFGTTADRDQYSKSFLLKAKLSEVLNHQGPVAWTRRDITETATVGNTSLPLGHPSGIIYDAKRGGIWSANAVYKALSHTRMTLYHPDTLMPLPGTAAVTIEDHIGTIGLIPDGRLMGMNWDSINLYYVNPGDKSTAADDSLTQIANTLTTAYQDCDTWDDAHILCSGLLKETDGIKYGRLHLLKVDALDTQGVQLVREVPEKRTDGSLRVRLGTADQENTYGTYKLTRTLANEGMAISADKQHVYFFPADLPAGKLVRYRITDR